MPSTKLKRPRRSTVVRKEIAALCAAGVPARYFFITGLMTHPNGRNHTLTSGFMWISHGAPTHRLFEKALRGSSDAAETARCRVIHAVELTYEEFQRRQTPAPDSVQLFDDSDAAGYTTIFPLPQ